MNAPARPIAITPGDPCGIGPEIVARAWLEHPQLTRGCFVVGDAGVMRRALALLPGTDTWGVRRIDTPAQALDLLSQPVPAYPGVGMGLGKVEVARFGPALFRFKFGAAHQQKSVARGHLGRHHRQRFTVIDVSAQHPFTAEGCQPGVGVGMHGW